MLPHEHDKLYWEERERRVLNMHKTTDVTSPQRREAMPRWYPDLESIQQCIEVVRQNEGDKRYNGIYPDNEAQLPRARKELAAYFREVWDDPVQAMEVASPYTQLVPGPMTMNDLDAMAGRKKNELNEQDAARIEVRIVHGASGFCIMEKFLALHKERIGDAVERIGRRLQQEASKGNFVPIKLSNS